MGDFLQKLVVPCVYISVVFDANFRALRSGEMAENVSVLLS